MKNDLNPFIEMFSTANIVLEGIYQMVILPGEKVKNQTTMKGVCGIVVPVRGRSKYKIAGKEYILEDAKVLFAGDQMPLDKQVLGEHVWEYYLIHYQLEGQVEGHENLKKSHFQLELNQQQLADIHQRIQQILVNDREGTPLSLFRNRGLFLELINYLFEYANWQEWDSEKELVRRSIQFIHDHFHEEITINDVASFFNINPKRYYYIFQKNVDMGPKQYLIRYRMRKAEEILLKEECFVTDVARRVGYEDAFHFSRIFKKYTGVAPSRFKEKFGKNT